MRNENAVAEWSGREDAGTRGRTAGHWRPHPAVLLCPVRPSAPSSNASDASSTRPTATVPFIAPLFFSTLLESPATVPHPLGDGDYHRALPLG